MWWRRAACRQGYTLIEILLVMGLMGLFTTLALPTYAASVSKLRLQNAVDQISADVRAAQGRAQREGKLTRVILVMGDVPGHYGNYSVEVATGSQAQPTCSDPNFRAVKRVDIQAEFRTYVVNPTFECLVFEPTGRLALASPQVIAESVPDADGDITPYFDGAERADLPSANPGFYYDRRLLHFPKSPAVTVTVDLGEPRPLEWVCAQVHRYQPAGNTPKVLYPNTIRVDWATVKGDVPPQSSEWVSGPQVTPTAEQRVVLNSSYPEWRSCEKINGVAPDETVRYIRLVFSMSSTVGGRTLYLDEIKLAAPGFTVENEGGSGSQRVTITPNTGRVSVN